MSDWSVYLVRCRDGSLYTGITTDVSRRLTENDGGDNGSKYLRGRGPLTLVCERKVGDRSVASRVEHCIKQLPKTEKEKLVLAPEQIDRISSTLMHGEIVQTLIENDGLAER